MHVCAHMYSSMHNKHSTLELIRFLLGFLLAHLGKFSKSPQTWKHSFNTCKQRMGDILSPCLEGEDWQQQLQTAFPS